MFKRTKGFVVGAALGSAITWLTDPQQGKRRRAGVTQAATKQVGRVRREGEKRAHYAEGRARGAAARATGHGQFHPVDDRELANHLHQVLAGIDADVTDINLEVVDGMVRVRGQVRLAAQRDRILDAIRDTPGVTDFEDLTHLPGEQAPNKAPSLDA